MAGKLSKIDRDALLSQILGAQSAVQRVGQAAHTATQATERYADGYAAQLVDGVRLPMRPFRGIPAKISAQVTVQIENHIQGGINVSYTDKREVTISLNEAAQIWTNDQDISWTGCTGTARAAYLYHPGYDQPMFKVDIDNAPTMIAGDTIGFTQGTLRIAGEALAHFDFPPENYQISEQPDAEDLL